MSVAGDPSRTVGNTKLDIPLWIDSLVNLLRNKVALTRFIDATVLQDRMLMATLLPFRFSCFAYHRKDTQE